jgi:hypothetical protein
MRSGIPGVARNYETPSVEPRTETTILQVESVRLDYDVERAMGGIRDSGLPDALADYLGTGGRLSPDDAPARG